jgi:hypothetical protein
VAGCAPLPAAQSNTGVRGAEQRVKLLRPSRCHPSYQSQRRCSGHRLGPECAAEDAEAPRFKRRGLQFSFDLNLLADSQFLQSRRVTGESSESYRVPGNPHLKRNDPGTGGIAFASHELCFSLDSLPLERLPFLLVDFENRPDLCIGIWDSLSQRNLRRAAETSSGKGTVSLFLRPISWATTSARFRGFSSTTAFAAGE